MNEAAQRGTTLMADQHARCGVGLSYIWNHPDELCVTPYFAGAYPAALSSNYVWNAVTLEPFYSTLTGSDGDAQMAVNFMGPRRRSYNPSFGALAHHCQIAVKAP